MKINRVFKLALVCYLFCSGVVQAQEKKSNEVTFLHDANKKIKENVNLEPYPYGNPVIKHMYTADASPHVMPDGRVWMVTSVDLDEGGGYSTMHSYHIFSSLDMLNWKDHGEVLHLNDVVNEDETNEDWALWAPDMIYHNGKYYLYFPVNIREKGATKAKLSYTAVAVCDKLGDRFKVIQDRIPGTKGIDPCVFRDDDGKVYLYYGSRWVAELDDNMIEFKSDIKSVNIDCEDRLANDESFNAQWVGTVDNKRFNVTNYMEGPWMHKRNGKYYFNYHTFYGSEVPNYEDDPTRRKSQLDFSYGESPCGPLKYGGVLNYELGVGVENGPRNEGYNYVPWRLNQSNHGGVVEFHGKDYLFYHTTALSSWRQDNFKAGGTWTQRSVCVDEIKYDENDMPLPVKQTIEGPQPVVVRQPFEIKLAKKENVKSNHVKFENVDFGTGYYYFDAKIRERDINGKLELRLGSPQGQLVGTVIVTSKQLKEQKGKLETAIRDAKGKQDLYLVWKGAEPLSQIESVRVYAGLPK